MDKKITSHLWMIATLLCIFGMQTAQSAQKPNIIYILADDLGYGDLSCFGQTKFSTPNIDKLASEGIKFTQHYSGTTVCAPSRSALLTGLHTGHTPTRGNKEVYPEGQYPIPADQVTFAKVLQGAGYTTGAFGKWGLGYPGSVGDPMNQGFDRFYGYNCQRYSHRYYPTHIWNNSTKEILEGNDWVHTNVYAQDLIHNETLKFIETNKDKPFMAYVAILLPHAELIAPNDSIYQKFDGKYSDWSWSGNDYGASNFKYSNYSSVEKRRTTYAAMVYRIDVYVGQIMQKLKDLGIDDNTLVIFTSDNGPHTEGGADPDFFKSYGPFRGYKRDLYEGGIRVPFIARWPSHIAPGTQSDLISAFWDMMPTFAEVAGVQAPQGIDGISMLPSLLGQAGQKEHKYLYWEFHEKNGRQAARMGRWKALRYNVKYDIDKPISLIDLDNDINERTNVAADHPDITAKLTFIMQNARSKNSMFNYGIPITTVQEVNLSTLSGAFTAKTGDTLQIKYSVLPDNATDARCNFQLISSAGMNPSLNEYGELFVGDSDGQIQLVAQSKDNLNVFDTLSITVGNSVILATKKAIQISNNTAKVEGELQNASTEVVQKIGFCYAVNMEPDINCDTVLAHQVNSKIEATIDSLGEDKLYIIKAFATTPSDTIYSKSASITLSATSNNGINNSYNLGDYIGEFLFYLPLDNHFNDVSGNTVPTPNGNPTFGQGAIGDGLYFDGIDDYIQIPAGVFNPSANDFTFLAWVKPELGSNDMIIFQQEDLAGTGRSILYASPSTNTFASYLGGTQTLTQSTINPGAWNHIAIVVQPSLGKVQMYVNSVAQSEVTRSIEPTEGEINIGRHKIGQMNEKSFKGYMDELMLVNGALSPTQIHQLMNGVFHKTAVITSSAKHTQQEIKIWPNPTLGNSFNLSIDKNMVGQRATIRVCDLNGKTIYADLFTVHSSNQHIEAGLAKGSYIVILDTQGNRYNSRLIVR